jgi:hypothetical protein
MQTPKFASTFDITWTVKGGNHSRQDNSLGAVILEEMTRKVVV